jgi:hypothetical protein
MPENIPESCVGASDAPWNSKEQACSHCGKRSADGENCGKCGKAFCEACASNPELVFHCDGCYFPYCAECSDSFRELLEMLAELRAEVKTLKGRLELAMLALKADPPPHAWTATKLPAEGAKRIEDVLSMSTRSRL